MPTASNFDQHQKAQLVLTHASTAFLHLIHDQDTPTDFLPDNGILKVYIIDGPELEEDGKILMLKEDGKILMLQETCYGLKSHPVSFHQQIFLISKALAPSQMNINNDNFGESITYVDDMTILTMDNTEV